MPRASVAIERFSITGIAAGEHAQPDRIKARLDALNVRVLEAAVARQLAPLVEDDERLVLLRRVDLGLTDGRGHDAATLADQLAGLLAVAVARLAHAPSDDTVIFADRRAFLAAFVRAVARGEAWDRWWFRRFDGLKFLTASAALRTALEEDPECGLAALASLSEADWAEVLQRLEPGDARRLLGSFAGGGGARDRLNDALALLAEAPVPATPRSADHLSLGRLLAAVAQGGDVPAASLARAVELIRELHSLGAAARKSVRAALAEGRMSALAGRLGPGEIARLAPLFAAAPETRRRLAADLSQPAADAPPPRDFTRFGGLMLVGPHLPAGCGGVIALLALAACSGPANLPEALGDRLLRDVLGLSPRPPPDEIQAWLYEQEPSQLDALYALGAPPSAADARWLATPAALRRQPRARAVVQGLANAALRDLARRLPGFSQASAAFLWRNLLDVGAWVAAEPQGLRATLQRPPLDVLLAMSGMAERTLALADGRVLQLERSP